MDPYVLGDGVLVMTPFCSVLQCLCARPLASALMRFRSAKRGVVMPTTLSRLAACVACLPATSCLEPALTSILATDPAGEPRPPPAAPPSKPGDFGHFQKHAI